MHDQPDRSAQASTTDLLVPPEDVFADLLARTLAELPAKPEPESKSEPEPAPPVEAAPRRSLMQRILGRRSRRPPVVVVPSPPLTEVDESEFLLLDDVVEDAVAPTAAAVPEMPVPEMPEREMPEREMDESEIDLLLRDEVVGEAGTATATVVAEPAPEQESEIDVPVMEAIPASLTPASIPFSADNRPGLLERLFGRHKVAPRTGEAARFDPPLLAAPLAEPAEPTAMVAEEGDEDVMILDDSFMVVVGSAPVVDEPPAAPPPPEPASPPMEIPPPPLQPTPGAPTDFLLQQVLDALARQASDATPCAPAPCAPGEEEASSQRDLLQKVLMALSTPAPAEPVPPPADPVAAAVDEATDDVLVLGDDDMVVSDEDVLVLDDSFVVAPLAPEPAPPVDVTADEMSGLIAAATPDGVGTLDLPENLESLARLLLTPPDDFAAQDLLHDCWPRGSSGITSRALLAVAVNLSRNFGLPGKLPMAAAKAWRMLDPQVFQNALAQRLAAIGDFISAWQHSQFTFLSLEFGEIELIEYLFESLHPGHNIELLASVMHFKVLSGRRIGLLRRIPGHARRVVDELGPRRQDEALVHLAHVKALLTRLSDPDGFPPIVEAAMRGVAEIEKQMKQVANPPPPPGDPQRGGGLGRLPLAKI